MLINNRINKLRNAPEIYQTILSIINDFDEIILDQNGYIKGYAGSLKVSSYAFEEIEEKHFGIFYPAEQLEEGSPESDLNYARQYGKKEFSGWRLRKNGSYFYARAILYSIYSGKTLKGFRYVIKDITYQTFYEENLNRVNRKYLNLFENDAIGIFKISNRSGKFLSVNMKALKILGYESPGSYSFSDINISNFRKQDLVNQITKEREICDCELLIKSPGGRYVWVNMSCKMFPYEGVIEGILMDVTEIKEKTTALERLNFELEKFVYHASHDLRAPLLSILGLINLLRLEKERKFVDRTLSLIERRVKDLDETVNQFLSVSYNNVNAIKSEHIDFGEEINDIIKNYGAYEKYRDVRIILTVNGSENFYSDKVRIKTILNNLISNAYKFRDLNKSDPYIKIDIKYNKKRSIITIEDNGLGIPADRIEKITTMFYRGHESLSGSGLGLYITKSMITKLGGELHVFSTPPGGSTFLIEIPNLQNKN